LTRFGQNWVEVWAELDRNLGNSNRFDQVWLDLGKIKILHPKKHPISYGYVITANFDMILYCRLVWISIFVRKILVFWCLLSQVLIYMSYLLIRKQKAERHKLKSVSGYVSKNGCEWDSNPYLLRYKTLI